MLKMLIPVTDFIRSELSFNVPPEQQRKRGKEFPPFIK
jgi:hypothetical protein